MKKLIENFEHLFYPFVQTNYVTQLAAQGTLNNT